jgi:hypothetical protein
LPSFTIAFLAKNGPFCRGADQVTVLGQNLSLT